MAPTKMTKRSAGSKKGSGGSCPECFKSFTRSGDLKRHIQTHVPAEERRWACEICMKRFVQKTALTTHMNSHSGDKPYVCGIGICDSLFSDPSSRSRHRREAHCSKMTHRCPVVHCTSHIKRRCAFTKHLRGKHQINKDEHELNEWLVPDEKMLLKEAKKDARRLSKEGKQRVRRHSRKAVKEESPLPEILVSCPPPPIRPVSQENALGLQMALPTVPTLAAPSRTTSPMSYYGGSTPDLSNSPGSSAPSNHFSSAFSSPSSGSYMLMSSPDYSPYLMPNGVSEYDDLMSTATSSYADLPKVETTFEYPIDYFPSPKSTWNEDAAFFPSHEQYSLDTDMSPLSGLSLAQLNGADHFAHPTPRSAEPALQSLYYDTTPHSLSTAWSQY
ncbi:hypothetical protein EUX98_g3508 [Antrodiella citrinella]|uniref:C2H2-type domain-containing protein n=1 Tax=Antrodiella citrinella TaxID=2447956 RepID=A0A4S4MWD6_9APHY|nr:hypothetical protein EUX98_g3508 [Antrodiella citrinella]